MANFHFLRPFWLFAFLPLIGLSIRLWCQRPRLKAFEEICDPHLLAHLYQKKGRGGQSLSFLWLNAWCFFMVLALAGPAWYKFPVVTYKTIKPRVFVLDMSKDMMNTDLSPNRLTRAKFKLHDALTQKGLGQFGLVVFTGEAFVISPLTEDGLTISSLLSSLSPDIMPVSGHQLDSALKEASQLIKTAGYPHGQILVLTAHSPSSAAIHLAEDLAEKGIFSSVMPMFADKNINPLFERFAKAGGGHLIPYSLDSHSLEQWLNSNKEQEFVLNQQDDIPLWRDEGRWFLIPALLLLWPLFRRGWLQRVQV